MLQLILAIKYMFKRRIASLAVLTVARGLAFILAEGRSIGNLPENFAWREKT